MKYYGAFYDNPKTFRREKWTSSGMIYSVCAFVILSKRVPNIFHEDWKSPFVAGQIIGDPSFVTEL